MFNQKPFYQQKSGSTGSIFIELNQPYYYTGDTVSGHINISLNQNFSGAKIKMKLKGWETVHWITKTRVVQSNDPNHPPFQPRESQLLDGSDCEVSSSTTDSSDGLKKPRKGYFRKHGELYKIENHNAHDEFMKFKQPLDYFGQGQLMAGQYKIPFQFVLGNDWPGSFTYKSKDVKARIKYEMKVKCDFFDKKDRDFSHKIELFVHERPKIMNDTQPQYKKLETNVKSCCCISKGETKITFYFDKNVYSIKDKALLNVEISNDDCDADVEDIRSTVLNVITLKDQHNYSKSFKDILLQTSLGSVPAGEDRKGDQRFVKEIIIDATNKQSNKSLRRLMSPTTSGKYIKSQYYLTAESIMDATCNGCCNAIPRIEFPIHINPPHFSPPQFSPPSDWNPQQFGVYQIPINPFSGNNNQAGQPMMHPQFQNNNQQQWNQQNQQQYQQQQGQYQNQHNNQNQQYYTQQGQQQYQPQDQQAMPDEYYQQQNQENQQNDQQQQQSQNQDLEQNEKAQDQETQQMEDQQAQAIDEEQQKVQNQKESDQAQGNAFSSKFSSMVNKIKVVNKISCINNKIEVEDDFPESDQSAVNDNEQQQQQQEKNNEDDLNQMQDDQQQEQQAEQQNEDKNINDENNQQQNEQAQNQE